MAGAATNITHSSLGRRGAGAIASIFLGLGNIFRVPHLPWPVVPVARGLVARGIAGLEHVAGAWAGRLLHAGGFLRMLQNYFSIGSAIAPLISIAMIQPGTPHYRYYYYNSVGLQGSVINHC